MYRKLIFLFVFSVFVTIKGFSQDFKKNFRKAKELFKEGNYSSAMDAFNSLSVYDKDNPYPEYALFYSGLSAQRMGFSTLAKTQFLQLKKTYPEWKQLNEANYWLAKLYFDQRDYFQALQVLTSIQDNLFRSSIDSLKQSYLYKIEDVETLKMIVEENPDDTLAIRAMVRAIGMQGFPNPDLILFDSILVKYNWPREGFIMAQSQRSVFKDRYRVALLFPFRVSTLEPSPEKKRNQPILDLYQGMKLAVDSLEKAGIHIDLLAYDTDKDAETTAAVLAEGELKSVDLIVGPLFSEEAKLVQQFSQDNKINLIVNPVSNNSDFLADNPFALLYQPSHETIGRKSAEMLAQRAVNKNCIVYYSDSPKDSIMAFNFIKRALELGLKVVYAEEVRNETSATILEKLATPTKYDEWKNPLEFTLKKDSIGSIFVAADSPLIYSKVINSVETRRDSVIVIGEESWLDDNTIDYGKLELTHVVFAAPNYCATDNSSYHRFRKKYLDHHGVLPSNYAGKGYEMLIVLGYAIHQYGSYFQDGLLLNGAVKGILAPGFWLQSSRDNGLIPFVSFEHGTLKEIK